MIGMIGDGTNDKEPDEVEPWRRMEKSVERVKETDAFGKLWQKNGHCSLRSLKSLCRVPCFLRMVRSALHRHPPPESERAGRLRSSGGLIFQFSLTPSEVLDCFYQG